MHTQPESGAPGQPAIPNDYSYYVDEETTEGNYVLLNILYYFLALHRACIHNQIRLCRRQQSRQQKRLRGLRYQTITLIMWMKKPLKATIYCSTCCTISSLFIVRVYKTRADCAADNKSACAACDTKRLLLLRGQRTCCT